MGIPDMTIPDVDLDLTWCNHTGHGLTGHDRTRCRLSGRDTTEHGLHPRHLVEAVGRDTCGDCQAAYKEDGGGTKEEMGVDEAAL